MTLPTFHDSPTFPPHNHLDLVDILAEVAYQWRRDNGAYCKELLEKALEGYPWSKELADWYGLIMSKIHHIYNDREMLQLHEWMAADQITKGQPFMITEEAERMGVMMGFLREWLVSHRRHEEHGEIFSGWEKTSLSEVRQWARIIDIGGHTGEMAINWIGLAGARHCTVVDIAKGHLVLGKRFFDDPRLDWVQAFADRLPIADNTMDVAVLSGILEHVRNPDELVAEAERVTRPGGCILIQVPYGGMEGAPNPAADALSFRSHVRCINPFRYSEGKKVLLSKYIRYSTGNVVLKHALLGEVGDYCIGYAVKKAT